MISRNFLKVSAIYTLAGALPMASAVILLPFYFYYLPTNVYGALSLYLAFSLFVQILVTYSFDTSVYIHYHDYKGDPAKLASFVSSSFVFMILLGAVVGLVMVAAGQTLFMLIFDDPKISFYPFGLMSVAIGISQAINKVYSSFLQSSERPLLYLFSNVFLFLSVAGLTIGGLYLFPGTLTGPIGGRLVAGIIVLFVTLFLVFAEFGYHFNYQLLWSIFGFNHYIFIHQVQQWIIGYFDRFLLLFFLPLSSIGIYDFAVKCLLIIEFAMNSLHNSFYPRVVSSITSLRVKSSTAELNRYYYGLVALAMIAVSLSILGLPFILKFFKSKNDYTEAIHYLPYLSIIYLPKAVKYYYAVPYGILKYTKPLPVISLIAAIVKIVFILLLIKKFSIFGVIVASLTSSVLEVWLLRYFIREKFNFRYNVFKMILAPGLLMGLVLLVEPISLHPFQWIAHLAYFAITIGFLLWVYRNELKLFRIPKIL